MKRACSKDARERCWICGTQPNPVRARPDRQRLGRERRLECHDAIEPSKKYRWLFWIKNSLGDLDELAIFKLAGDPLPAIRSNSNEFLALLPLAIGEILWHLALNVSPFLCKVALGFENSSADQSVETTAHFDNGVLEIEVGEFRAKFVGQQIPETGLDLIVARFTGEMPEKLYCGFACHPPTLAGDLEPDNAKGQAMQRFLHADSSGA